VTPFTDDGKIDHESLARQCRWLADVEGVTGLVCNGHAGEGLSLTEEERLAVIHAAIEATEGRVPVVAGVGAEGSRLAGAEAARAASAGATGVLLYPTHIWLRMGYQRGAPQDRYRAVAEQAGIPLILFLYPSATKASYDLETILEICSDPRVIAVKHGARDMGRWDTEIPILRRELPELRILTSTDEYLLHTLWEADGAILSYGALIPEILVDLIAAARRHDYPAAKRIYDRIVPLTKAIYLREPHVTATVALKVGLRSRGVIATDLVRSPLLALDPATVSEVRAALEYARIEVAIPTG
jgi:4-hydroxy-tetrahydrodipicolinate synthase